MKKLLLVALLVTLAAPAAHAKKKIMANFKATYNTSLDGCVICHVSEDDETFNAYGQDLSDNGINFKAIEAKDSDGDGKTNLEEINAGSFPGDMSSVL